MRREGAGRTSPAVASPRKAVFLALALLAVPCLATAAPLGAPAAPRRAFLLRGADAVKGLPFFAPNAIAALSGLYALEDPSAAGIPERGAPEMPARGRAAQVALWYSREAIVFSSAWKRFESRGIGTFPDSAYSLERSEGRVLALRSEGYTLFFELPGDPREIDFARAFSGKFPIFFRSAASDAELSFPAYVDY
jgi:hypothetical protein